MVTSLHRTDCLSLAAALLLAAGGCQGTAPRTPPPAQPPAAQQGSGVSLRRPTTEPGTTATTAPTTFPTLPARLPGHALSPAASLLREAEVAILTDPEASRFWSPSPRMVRLQLSAGDLEGAVTTLGLMRQGWEPDAGWAMVAEALARAGDEPAAMEAARRVTDSASTWDNRERVSQRVLLRLCERAARAAGPDDHGDGNPQALERASALAEPIRDAECRAQALAAVGAAQWRLGDAARAAESWRRAAESALALDRGFDRAHMLIRIAKVRGAAGDRRGAREQLGQLVRSSEGFEHARERAYALREAAAEVAVTDEGAATDWFGRALAAARDCGRETGAQAERQALSNLAKAQARAGCLAAAVQTLRSVPREPGNVFDRGEVEEAVRDVARGELSAGRIGEAVKLAPLVTDFRQYHEEILVEAVRATVAAAKPNWAADALKISRDLDDPSRRAQATLLVAAGQARAGDRPAAAQTAGTTSFLRADLPFWGPAAFDYRDPKTWAVEYDFTGACTMVSAHLSAEKAGDVAAAAAECAAALKEGKNGPIEFVAAFGEAWTDDGVLAKVAAAQVRAGQADVALRWARALPRGGKRAWALIGIAEAQLESEGEAVGTDRAAED